jgi:hypothetical protein
MALALAKSINDSRLEGIILKISQVQKLHLFDAYNVFHKSPSKWLLVIQPSSGESVVMPMTYSTITPFKMIILKTAKSRLAFLMPNNIFHRNSIHEKWDLNQGHNECICNPFSCRLQFCGDGIHHSILVSFVPILDMHHSFSSFHPSGFPHHQSVIYT